MGNRLNSPDLRPEDRVNDLVEVELKRGRTRRGLGLTIAGGIGNQHIPGDNGIFITRIWEDEGASSDLRIDVGDMILSVKNYPGGEYVLDNCTHEEVGQLQGDTSGWTKPPVDMKTKVAF